MHPVLHRTLKRALIEGAGVLNAASPSKQKLVANSGDLNWVVCGDSTGNQTGEFIYLWFAWLATFFPAYTFEYYPPDGAGGYGAVVTVQTGTGPHTFRLYNNSVSGTTPPYFMGSLFDGAFVTPGRDWDAILWNHGKNYVSAQSTPIVQGSISAAIAQVQLSFPTAQHIAVLQYPQRDDSNMALIVAVWRDIAASAPGISLIDLSSGSYEYADYSDNSHLTLDANATKLLPKMQAWSNGTRAGTWTPETPWLEAVVANMLDGANGEDYGNFALDGVSGSSPGAATGGVPFGWTNAGTIAYDQEASIVYDGAARSQKLQGSGATAAYMRKGLVAANLEALKGNYAMLTVIEYVPAGAAGTVGRLSVVSNGTGAVSVSSSAAALGQGAFKVVCLGPCLFPADMTTLNSYIYHDSAVAPDATHPVYPQWACLSLGKLPRAVAPNLYDPAEVSPKSGADDGVIAADSFSFSVTGATAGQTNTIVALPPLEAGRTYRVSFDVGAYGSNGGVYARTGAGGAGSTLASTLWTDATSGYALDFTPVSTVASLWFYTNGIGTGMEINNLRIKPLA